MACRKRRTANSAIYFAINGLWPSLYFDQVVKRIAVHAVELRGYRPGMMGVAINVAKLPDAATLLPSHPEK